MPFALNGQRLESGAAAEGGPEEPCGRRAVALLCPQLRLLAGACSPAWPGLVHAEGLDVVGGGAELRLAAVEHVRADDVLLGRRHPFVHEPVVEDQHPTRPRLDLRHHQLWITCQALGDSTEGAC